MAKSTKKTGDGNEKIEIAQIGMGRMKFHLLGTSPMIMHRFAAKAWQELLLPSAKKNAAAKAESLKHDPLQEFRECIYRNRDPERPTAVHFPSGAFSKAIAAAALDLPGASKAQILRLVSVTSVQVDIYGVPTLGMDMVRSSDMARTPDVRTRAYFAEWACAIDVEFVASLIGEAQITNLLAAAGIITGLGDYRPQKGGNFGKFKVVMRDDPEFLRVLKQDRRAQEAAMADPSFYNEEAAELYGWFNDEVKRREKTLQSSLDDGKPAKQPKTPAESDTKRGKNGQASHA